MSRSVVRDTGVIAFFTGISRVLGLVRDQVFFALFGAGASHLNDAYVAAFRIPNLFRDLFAEGALSAAFVPTFSGVLEKQGKDESWALGNRVIGAVLVVVGALVVLGAMAAPWIVRVIAPGFEEIPGKAALTSELTRILWPFLLVVALASVWMGMLNAHGRFAVPASASTMFNLGSILVGVTLAYALDPTWGPRAMVGMALGTLCGGALQWLVQVPALRAEGFRLRPRVDFADDGFRRVVRLMGPAVVGTSAVQVNVLVNTMFASTMGNGPISWLSGAFRLVQFPIGVFGVAVGAAALPSLSRAAARGDAEDYRTTLARSLRLVAFLCIPSAVGLAVLAEPLIGAIFQHGRFTAADTAQTGSALRYYAIGLAGYAAIKVLAPASYALGDSRTPAMVSVFSIVVNLVMNGLFTWRFGWGHRGLALAVSAVALVNSSLLFVAVHRRCALDLRWIAHGAGKVLGASAAMGAACWWVARAGTDLLGMSFPARLAVLCTAFGAALGVFWAAARLLGVEEASEVVAQVRRRLSR
jgi:putative peptidoglycan lipid II flippase